jgi:hypothetical protein
MKEGVDCCVSIIDRPDYAAPGIFGPENRFDPFCSQFRHYFAINGFESIK